MTLADDISSLQDTVSSLTGTMTGGPQPGGAPAVSLSTDDWNTILGSIAILNQNAQFTNSNDYASLVNAINAIKTKWDGTAHVAAAFAPQLTQLQNDAIQAGMPPAPMSPPAPGTPGVVVVPGTSATTVVPGAQTGFTGGQTAAVGLVGAAVGLGVGWMMWKNPRRSNPRRRRHRKVNEETA